MRGTRAFTKGICASFLLQEYSKNRAGVTSFQVRIVLVASAHDARFGSFCHLINLVELYHG